MGVQIPGEGQINPSKVTLPNRNLNTDAAKAMESLTELGTAPLDGFGGRCLRASMSGGSGNAGMTVDKAERPKEKIKREEESEEKKDAVPKHAFNFDTSNNVDSWA